MSNETKAADSGTIGTGHPSRRTLVRTAAWSVPVISTVAAAPAFAAASDVLNFSSAPSGSRPPNTSKTLQLSLTVRNDSTTDDTLGLQVTVVFPSSYNKPTYVSHNGNWSAPQVTGNTFVFTATQQAAKNGGTVPLSFVMTVNNSAQATNSINVTASATNGFTAASAPNVSAPAL